MTCPLTNQGRMLNFIESLSKQNKLHIFSVEDKKAIQVQNENTNYYQYKLKDKWYKKITKHSFFWLLNRSLFDVVNKHLLQKKIDLIICHDLPTLRPAIDLKNKLGCPLLYDSLEIYTETINQFFPGVYGVKKKIAALLIFFMRTSGAIAEGKMMRKCDSITTVNTSLAEYFKRKYNQKKIDVIMNCPASIKIRESEVNFRLKYQLEKSDSVFLYQGVLNEGRGLDLLVESFKRASKTHANIKLVILGDGVLKNHLVQNVNMLGLDKTVFFHEPVPYKDLLQYTVAADFGVNLLEAFNLSKKYASPNKIFEYMQAEIPVLCSFSPENDIIFENYNIGVQCHNKVIDISEKIIQLHNLKNEEIINFKKQLKKAQKVYCWENQELKLFNLIGEQTS